MNPADHVVRDARPEDAARCAEIYAPYVRDTAISFELDPPDAAAMAGRIAAGQQQHAWLVHDGPDGVVGYAYGSAHRERAAYRWACDVSVYLEPGLRRTGAGRSLYLVLFDRLVARGYRRALAGVTLPNPASEGLHRALGFEPVGVYRRIGWKHGAWHDVMWWQRDLSSCEHDGSDPPADPS